MDGSRISQRKSTGGVAWAAVAVDLAAACDSEPSNNVLAT
jgi:hypothetical protein